MIVLAIVGFIIVTMGLYIFFEYLNDLIQRRYGYEFYSIGNLIQVIIAYWLMYFGDKLYMKALKVDGDPLNGGLLLAIGVVMVIIVIYKNFKAVPFFEALIFTILELLICIPLSVGVLFALLILMAALAETKPVYVLNN